MGAPAVQAALRRLATGLYSAVRPTAPPPAAPAPPVAAVGVATQSPPPSTRPGDRAVVSLVMLQTLIALRIMAPDAPPFEVFLPLHHLDELRSFAGRRFWAGAAVCAAASAALLEPYLALLMFHLVFLITCLEWGEFSQPAAGICAVLYGAYANTFVNTSAAYYGTIMGGPVGAALTHCAVGFVCAAFLRQSYALQLSPPPPAVGGHGGEGAAAAGGGGLHQLQALLVAPLVPLGAAKDRLLEGTPLGTKVLPQAWRCLRACAVVAEALFGVRWLATFVLWLLMREAGQESRLSSGAVHMLHFAQLMLAEACFDSWFHLGTTAATLLVGVAVVIAVVPPLALEGVANLCVGAALLAFAADSAGLPRLVVAAVQVPGGRQAPHPTLSVRPGAAASSELLAPSLCWFAMLLAEFGVSEIPVGLPEHRSPRLLATFLHANAVACTAMLLARVVRDLTIASESLWERTQAWALPASERRAADTYRVDGYLRGQLLFDGATPRECESLMKSLGVSGASTPADYDALAARELLGRQMATSGGPPSHRAAAAAKQGGGAANGAAAAIITAARRAGADSAAAPRAGAGGRSRAAAAAQDDEHPAVAQAVADGEDQTSVRSTPPAASDSPAESRQAADETSSPLVEPADAAHTSGADATDAAAPDSAPATEAGALGGSKSTGGDGRNRSPFSASPGDATPLNTPPPKSTPPAAPPATPPPAPLAASAPTTALRPGKPDPEERKRQRRAEERRQQDQRAIEAAALRERVRREQELLALLGAERQARDRSVAAAERQARDELGAALLSGRDRLRERERQRRRKAEEKERQVAADAARRAQAAAEKERRERDRLDKVERLKAERAVRLEAQAKADAQAKARAKEQQIAKEKAAAGRAPPEVTKVGKAAATAPRPGGEAAVAKHLDNRRCSAPEMPLPRRARDKSAAADAPVDSPAATPSRGTKDPRGALPVPRTRAAASKLPSPLDSAAPVAADLGADPSAVGLALSGSASSAAGRSVCHSASGAAAPLSAATGARALPAGTEEADGGTGNTSVASRASRTSRASRMSASGPTSTDPDPSLAAAVAAAAAASALTEEEQQADAASAILAELRARTSGESGDAQPFTAGAGGFRVYAGGATPPGDGRPVMGFGAELSGSGRTAHDPALVRAVEAPPFVPGSAGNGAAAGGWAGTGAGAVTMAGGGGGGASGLQGRYGTHHVIQPAGGSPVRMSGGSAAASGPLGHAGGAIAMPALQTAAGLPLPAAPPIDDALHAGSDHAGWGELLAQIHSDPLADRGPRPAHQPPPSPPLAGFTVTAGGESVAGGGSPGLGAARANALTAGFPPVMAGGGSAFVEPGLPQRLAAAAEAGAGLGTGQGFALGLTSPGLLLSVGGATPAAGAATSSQSASTAPPPYGAATLQAPALAQAQPRQEQHVLCQLPDGRMVAIPASTLQSHPLAATTAAAAAQQQPMQ